MDLKQIEKLMNAMNRAGMQRIALKEKGFELELEKPSLATQTVAVATPEPTASSAKSAEEKKKQPKAEFITSPMVGTFYATPSPDDPPFAKEGDSVEEQTVVCIIEAMKVMNEVKALMRGTILEVLVKNGDPVEFGTKLFRISS